MIARCASSLFVRSGLCFKFIDSLMRNPALAIPFFSIRESFMRSYPGILNCCLMSSAFRLSSCIAKISMLLSWITFWTFATEFEKLDGPLFQVAKIISFLMFPLVQCAILFCCFLKKKNCFICCFLPFFCFLLFFVFFVIFYWFF